MSESTQKRKMGRKSARQLSNRTVHSAYTPKIISICVSQLRRGGVLRSRSPEVMQ